MDERATFEPQAVLTRRRAGRNRLLLVVPVLAIAATAWAGLSGREPSGSVHSPGPNENGATGKGAKLISHVRLLRGWR